MLLWDEVAGGYFFSAAPDVLVRKKEIVDGATPSGNSVSLCNLLKLSALTGSEEYRERAAKVLKHLSPYIERYPSALTKALQGVDVMTDHLYEVVLAGAETEIMRMAPSFWREFLPTSVLARASDEAGAPPIGRGKSAVAGEGTIYVCEGHTCSVPQHDVAAAIALLQKAPFV